MSDPHVKYLLIGGGLASSSAIEAIRAIDPVGPALLCGQEINRPYHRPPLSKEFLRHQKRHDDLFTLPEDWFTKYRVQLKTGCRASHLDCARDSVAFDDGQEITFDRLLIATGASPAPLAIPGADLPNVFYLRTIEDAEHLQTIVDQTRRVGRPHDRGRGVAAVIGGGVLGVELAASLTQMGMSVHLLLRAPHPWSKFAGENTGRFIAKYLEKFGVTVHASAAPQKLEGDGRVQRVVLANAETIACDFAVAAVGRNVNKDLLRGSSISAEKAILVDQRCQTSVPGVYAAGDCAAVFDPLFGKHRQVDHWENAIVTGTIAGKNMAGQDAKFDMVSGFFSDVFELSINVWGESRHVERRLLRGTPNVDAPDFVEIGVGADGRISQVVSVGHMGEDDGLKSLVSRRLAVEGKEEALKDPTEKLIDG